MSPSKRGPIAATLMLGLANGGAAAGAVSETLIFVAADGEHYWVQRAVRSATRPYRLHVDKSLRLEQLGYVAPNDFRWDDGGRHSNVLTFEHGDFTVMYPGRFAADELTREADGTFVLRSRDEPTRGDGHVDLSPEPGTLTRVAYAWILPAHFDVVDYRSDRDGQWVERNRTLTFFADDANDLGFEIRYRERDSDGDGIGDRDDRCPDSAPPLAVDASGCAADRERDAGAVAADRRPDAAADPAVAAGGDASDDDSDADGVVDADDRCPGAPTGRAVDDTGCAPDTDGDAVVDVDDACPDTPLGNAVDATGCELDSDADGVVDVLDECPDTPTGRTVDGFGCERDADGDGVVDASDACPATPAATVVDAVGCALDDDNDGVANAADLCPGTPSRGTADTTGCAKGRAIRLDGVDFVSDSAALTADSLAVLDRVAAALRQHRDLALEVAGHTDTQGDAAHNRGLSQRRADAVQQYLLDRGVRIKALIARGHGADDPVADNDSADGRAMNRRVELRRLGE